MVAGVLRFSRCRRLKTLRPNAAMATKKMMKMRAQLTEVDHFLQKLMEFAAFGGGSQETTDSESSSICVIVRSFLSESTVSSTMLSYSSVVMSRDAV